VLLIAVSAVNWPFSVWLEGNLCFLPALGAGHFKHWPAKLIFAHIVFFHLFLIRPASPALDNSVGIVLKSPLFGKKSRGTSAFPSTIGVLLALF